MNMMSKICINGRNRRPVINAVLVSAPGETLWVKPMDDKIYCCAECFVEDHDGYVLEGSPGDSDYESWFEDNVEGL